MAFGQWSNQYGGYGTPYTPGYYGPGQPMQDQLAQLRSGQFQQPQQGAASQAAPGGSGIIWVQGEAGAKSYLVAPGNSVLLMDSETQAFYLKSADASGMPSMRTFDYRERVQQPQQTPVAKPAEYVTREEFNALAARLDGLTAKKPPKKSQEVTDDAEPAV